MYYIGWRLRCVTDRVLCQPDNIYIPILDLEIQMNSIETVVYIDLVVLFLFFLRDHEAKFERNFLLILEYICRSAFLTSFANGIKRNNITIQRKPADIETGVLGIESRSILAKEKFIANSATETNRREYAAFFEFGLAMCEEP